MRLFRIFHWRARSRYWQRKAEKFERTVAMLRRELNAEMERNRSREDAFASAAAFGARGMYGIAARVGPALLPVSQAQPTTATDPWANLPWADKAEFQTEWWPLAQQSGRSEMQARQDFMRELANRRQLQDEPFGVQ